MRLKLIPFITFAFLLVLSTDAANAACTTHLYNNSDYQWSVSGFNADKTTIIVSPHTIADIPWGVSTEVIISGNIPARTYIRSFQVQAQQDCITILHQGNTGNVTLNKPNPGDIATCAGGC
jgi:hypothetical protein